MVYPTYAIEKVDHDSKQTQRLYVDLKDVPDLYWYDFIKGKNQYQALKILCINQYYLKMQFVGAYSSSYESFIGFANYNKILIFKLLTK